MPFLTKTRFKEAIECPDRMFYFGKKKEYADNRLDNEFLRELAKNGIQVGELAKCYFPGGIEITATSNADAIAETSKFLKRENVILYEAALSVDNLLVRVDVLVKTGGKVDLIEVKSKSIFDEAEIFTKKKEIDSNWKEYVYDIAFQFYVAQSVLKGFQLKGCLYLIDKKSKCTVDELYQKFRLKKIGDRYKVEVNPDIQLGDPILIKIDLTDTILGIIAGQEEIDGKIYSFSDYVKTLADAAYADQFLKVKTGRHCKSCPYKTTNEDKSKGLKSGFEECWLEKEGFNEQQFLTPSVFEIWKLHYSKLESFLASKRPFLVDIKKEDLLPKTKTKSIAGKILSDPERQWLQIERALNPSLGPYVDKEGIKAEFNNLKFPLNFIDFEVAMNGIPYKKGLSPYHRFAFQFSHHVLKQDGTLVHSGQWIETRLGHNPNIEFVRKLKQELSTNEGTILIYSQYENVILLHLHNVISSSSEADRLELLKFIESITWCDSDQGKWIGQQAMIDMKNWVMNFYLSRHMKNSNSIKSVLPAIIQESPFLQKKYGSATYGSKQLPSWNFENKEWIKPNGSGGFIDPYKLLPPIFDGLDREAIELLFEEEDLADGGAAMCAYNLMQFMEMTGEERGAIVSALYKYCELDTLAMVMVYEGLSDLSKN